MYSRQTRIVRLMFVADRCENPATRMEALRMAYEEIKKGEDTRLHREVAQRMIAGRFDLDYELDLEWTNAVDRRAEYRKEKLYSDLNSYKYLENLKANLLLDIHLHDHVEALLIRHKAIIQYTHPFISVDFHTMADAFKTSVSGLEKELEALITDNQIQAWINSHNEDQRNATFQRILQMGIEFDKDVKAMLRGNLFKHEYNVKATRKFGFS